MGGYPIKELHSPSSPSSFLSSPLIQSTSNINEKSTVRKTYQGPPLANLRMIFTNEMATEAYLCYEKKLNENKKIEEYNFFSDMLFYQISEEYLTDSNIYLLSSFQKENITRIINYVNKYHQMNQLEWNTTLLKSFSNLITEILVLITMSRYELFEKSSEYRIWREYERKCVHHHIKQEFGALVASASPSSSLTTNNIPAVLTPSYYLKKAFSKISTSLIRKLVNISWFKTTLKCLENMPFGLSVITSGINQISSSTLTTSTTTTPIPPSTVVSTSSTLCYVNDEYLRLTGYQKFHILGRSTTFLQEVNLENEIGQQFIEGKIYTSLIKMKRKDGSEIILYTILKPIFDLNLTYRYLIRLHCNIEHTSPYEIKIMEDLCQLIPSKLYIDIIDEDLTDLNQRQGKNSQSKLTTCID